MSYLRVTEVEVESTCIGCGAEEIVKSIYACRVDDHDNVAPLARLAFCPHCFATLIKELVPGNLGRLLAEGV